MAVTARGSTAASLCSLAALAALLLLAPSGGHATHMMDESDPDFLDIASSDEPLEPEDFINAVVRP